LIAQGMAPFSPETANLRAGRTMLGRSDHLPHGAFPSLSKLRCPAEAI
jgi:hypothetical protein